jgi:exopolysaccharide production protein ExoQ
MSISVNRARPNVSAIGSVSAALLRGLPVFGIYYVLLVLPFIPRDAAGERVENILFWPMAAFLTLAVVFYNRSQIDYRFFRSLPMMALIAYLLYAAASVTWAYNSDISFSRLAVEVLGIIVVVLPFAIPVDTKQTLKVVHLCYVLALLVSAGFVLMTPPSPIGHPGYFVHKQLLGLLAAVGIILSSYELLQRGWRRYVGAVAVGLAFWLVVESQSKSAIALAFVAVFSSWLLLLLCKKMRLTPAYFVAAVVIASFLVQSPVEKLGYRLYGDGSLSGRTGIWGFIETQVSHRPWLGWGFHSYWFVPNSPHNAAPGYIRDMPSSHSGYLELRLETGRIGYGIFLVFIFSSLHLLERVRRKNAVLAWCFLSIELFAILINLLDTHWLVLTHLWLLFLMVVAESIRYSLLNGLTGPAAIVQGNQTRSSGALRARERVRTGIG